MGKVTGFPQTRNAVILVVVVVVVDVQAARGKAPNNDEWTCTDVRSCHQDQKQHLHLSPLLVFYLEIRVFTLLLARHRHEVLS